MSCSLLRLTEFLILMGFICGLSTTLFGFVHIGVKFSSNLAIKREKGGQKTYLKVLSSEMDPAEMRLIR